MKKKTMPSNTEKSVPREEPSYWEALNVVPSNRKVGQTYIISTRQPLPKTKDSNDGVEMDSRTNATTLRRT